MTSCTSHCFNCTEMGYIRANCPKLSKLYPFDISSVGSVEVMCDSVNVIVKIMCSHSVIQKKDVS